MWGVIRPLFPFSSRGNQICSPPITRANPIRCHQQDRGNWKPRGSVGVRGWSAVEENRIPGCHKGRSNSRWFLAPPCSGSLGARGLLGTPLFAFEDPDRAWGCVRSPGWGGELRIRVGLGGLGRKLGALTNVAPQKCCCLARRLWGSPESGVCQAAPLLSSRALSPGMAPLGGSLWGPPGPRSSSLAAPDLVILR